MIGFQKENVNFTKESIARYVDGETMGGLMYDYEYRGTDSYIHFPQYFILWDKGISTSFWIDDRFGRIGRKADYEMLPRYEPWIGKFKTPYNNEYKNLDMILIHGAIPEWDKHCFDESRLVDIGSNWYIYKNLSEDD
jgi:hypothetical protein